MSDFPTFDDLFTAGEDEILARSSALSRAVVEREGTDANALVGGMSAIGDVCIGQVVATEVGLFIDSAGDSQIDRLLWDRYQILRKPASPSVGSVNFSTTTPVPVGFTIPANTQLATSDGRAFQTTADIPFPALSTGPITVPVQSLLSGLTQQAAIGTITTISSSIPGATSDLVVTNPLATAGAADQESVDAFKERGRTYYASSRRGTLAAIQQGAVAVPGVSAATAFEVIDPSGQAARVVNLVVTDTFTAQLVNATTNPATYQAQAATIIAQIQAGITDYRAAGIGVAITLATLVMVPVLLALRFQAGADFAATSLAARSAVVAYINGLAPGETMSIAGIESILSTVPGVIAGAGSVVSPAGDVVPTLFQVLRTQLGMVLIGTSGTSS